MERWHCGEVGAVEKWALIGVSRGEVDDVVVGMRGSHGEVGGVERWELWEVGPVERWAL